MGLNPLVQGSWDSRISTTDTPECLLLSCGDKSGEMLSGNFLPWNELPIHSRLVLQPAGICSRGCLRALLSLCRCPFFWRVFLLVPLCWSCLLNQSAAEHPRSCGHAFGCRFTFLGWFAFLGPGLFRFVLSSNGGASAATMVCGCNSYLLFLWQVPSISSGPSQVFTDWRVE